ncbi:MAG: hypothetical protein JWN34_3169 [Bryobacterales bacterium]|nr:hypothetical protein [Bryobacterales bacterium]
MKRTLGRNTALALTALAAVWGLAPTSAQKLSETGPPTASLSARPVSESPSGFTTADSECSFFGAQRDRFLPKFRLNSESAPGIATRQFFRARAVSTSDAPRSTPFADAQYAGPGNLIDQYIWQDLQANNVTPAAKTTDYEFVRRATLDLTGRIPKAARVTSFVQKPDRAALIDELLASPEWVDKWTMYFGDHFKNTASTVQVQIRPEGRNAFYKYLRDSLAANKPYNKIATEMIAAQGDNSFDQNNGQMNYLALGIVTGGPQQDIFDSQTAKIAREFLGIAHMDCLLCHNGRGHLETLSLWGSRATRSQAWGLSAFMAKTQVRNIATPQDPNNPNARYNYFAIQRLTTDYNLNTTTGNRPARQPIGATRVITPNYPFGNQVPNSGEDYRVALARNVTSDFQFARASVNYIWAELFGRGIVDPPDQFDPARIDPDNPPAEPWTLQPSNPRLLNALAQYFIDSNYDLKALMRLIVTSDTYQLSSEYKGVWNPAWEKYFARHFVRRLWGEELHDSVVTATDTIPVYTVAGFSNASTVYSVDSPGFGNINFAMQAPDVVNMPGRDATPFIDLFIRGNRDDQPRKSEGSVLQALGLMNDAFIQNRIHATVTAGTNSYLMNALALPADQLVSKLYLDVLSRNPSAEERTLALAQLNQSTNATLKRTNAEDLLWALFNKVDFVFNY